MQVDSVVVRFLHMDALIVVMVVVNHFFVDHQVRKPLRLFRHHKRRDPRQRLPEHDSDQDEGLVGAKHEQSIEGLEDGPPPADELPAQGRASGGE